MLLLLSASHPGFGYFMFAAGAVLLLLLAVAWTAWQVVFLRAHRNWSRWFAVAPVGGALVLAAAAYDVPLQARWALSRPAYERVVERLPPVPPGADAADWTAVDTPGRLGLYRVSAAYRVPRGGVVFYEPTGALFNDAGFAYLPDGPSPDLAHGGFEDPRFRHLGGPWYAWTASW